MADNMARQSITLAMQITERAASIMEHQHSLCLVLEITATVNIRLE